MEHDLQIKSVLDEWFDEGYEAGVEDSSNDDNTSQYEERMESEA